MENLTIKYLVNVNVKCNNLLFVKKKKKILDDFLTFYKKLFDK